MALPETASLLSFDEWMHYIRAIGYAREWQIVALIALIQSKSDLSSLDDLNQACTAADQLKLDESFMCTDEQAKQFENVKSHLQKAFCKRRFNSEKENVKDVKEAVAVLEDMANDSKQVKDLADELLLELGNNYITGIK